MRACNVRIVGNLHIGDTRVWQTASHEFPLQQTDQQPVPPTACPTVAPHTMLRFTRRVFTTLGRSTLKRSYSSTKTLLLEYIYHSLLK